MEWAFETPTFRAMGLHGVTDGILGVYEASVAVGAGRPVETGGARTSQG